MFDWLTLHYENKKNLYEEILVDRLIITFELHIRKYQSTPYFFPVNTRKKKEYRIEKEYTRRWWWQKKF